MNYDEMDGDRLRLPANRNCYGLSRVSWAFLKLLVLYVCKTQMGEPKGRQASNEGPWPPWTLLAPPLCPTP